MIDVDCRGCIDFKNEMMMDDVIVLSELDPKQQQSTNDNNNDIDDTITSYNKYAPFPH
jgi:hypothetical protein